MYDHHQRKIMAFGKYTQLFEINATCQLHTIHTNNKCVVIRVVVLLLCASAQDVHYRITSRKRSVGGNV